MPTTAVDAIQHYFAVGDVVLVPMVVTSIDGTATEPTVTGTTKYAAFDEDHDTVGPFDCNQVLKDE